RRRSATRRRSVSRPAPTSPPPRKSSSATTATSARAPTTTPSTSACASASDTQAWVSAPTAIEDFQEVVDLGLPVAFVAGMKGVRHAVLQMVAERLLLDAVERRADGADLRQHVDAVAVLLDHAGDTPHLALDAAKPGELGLLQSLIHT